ncbi:MAG: hypothetical protein E3J56_01030 [Candidatus Aminicenantes bacterium]|nr:MAG: hypothetical protein E3J56_01030 [Candidatus Aminicenantes bacterium]
MHKMVDKEKKVEEKKKLPNDEELVKLMKQGKTVVAGEIINMEKVPEGRGKSAVKYNAEEEGEENPEQESIFDESWAKKKQSQAIGKKKR